MTTIRPAREGDIEAAADLLMYWKSPDVELGRDILLAENTDGLVGYADVGVHGDSVWLDVRGTGAVQVYERAGMHVERTHLIFERSKP
jgi:hypothetical protein